MTTNTFIAVYIWNVVCYTDLATRQLAIIRSNYCCLWDLAD